MLALLISLFAGLAVGQTGRIIVTTDVEMIGTTTLSGGGHIYFTAVGGEARDLRQKILYKYDDGNGVIDADEALSYSLDVQDYLENPPWGVFGTEYRYGRMKSVSLDEGNSNAGVQASSSGLVGTDEDETGSLSMTLRFTMETDEARKTFVQDEVAIARAFYAVFSVELATDFETTVGPFPQPFAWPVVGGALYAGNTSTLEYDNDTRMVMDSVYMRLNASSMCLLNFSYIGNVANGGDYLAFLTSTDGVNWNEIYNISVSNSTASWIDVSLDLTQDHAGKEFFLRLLFKSDSMNNAEGFRIDDLVVYAPTVYDGRIEMHHTDYLLGVTSFNNIDAPRGTVHLIRTPGGMIQSYGAEFDYAQSGRDRTAFVDFDVFENPQLLFVLIFILTYFLLSAQNKFYMSFKMAHPRQYRAGAVRIKWLHLLGKVFVLLYIIFYFFPSLFVFLGAKVYLTGLFMWIFTIATFVGMLLTTKILYDRKTTMIPPVPEEEEEFFLPEEAPIAAEAASPPPVHSTLSCTVCMDEIMNMREAVRCRCGQIYHKNCAAKVSTCPACGEELDVGEEEEKVMTTGKCSSCGDIVLIEEGADLMKTICENCGSVLKIVDTGYNHLMVDESPTTAYEQFNSLLKKGLAGLVISTTYPEKLKRQISVENADLYWLTDTSSDFKTLDPKRLDFEIMRAVTNFAKTSEGGVILLDGIEYLAIENGFDAALKFVKKVNDLCSINDATLIVPIAPLSLPQDQLSMLKKEFDRVEMLTAKTVEG